MQWILITGAAKGLGAAIALALAEERHNLVLHYGRSKKEVDEVVVQCRKKGVQAESLQGDFSTEGGVGEFIDSYLKQYSSTYGLINNVGNYLIKSATATSLEEWHTLFQTNLFAPILLMNALSDSLKRERGRVVTLGTVGVSSARGYKKAVGYSVSKIALYQTMLSYAKEWAQEGVCVNMVSPGYMENAVDLADAILPMGRPAELEEVARIVAFLCACENGYITGQNIEIAGGFGL